MPKSAGMSLITTYRDVLKNEHERRLRANPQYSLRAFARDLRIAPQVLSMVLRSKKGISIDTGARLAERMNLTEAETEDFCDLILLEHSRSKAVKSLASQRIKNSRARRKTFRQLTEDTFLFVQDINHAALLELCDTKGFRSDLKWIAGRLKVKPALASSAIERLLRLGLLKKEGGVLKRSENHLMTTDGIPSEAIRQFHRQALARAAEALETQSIDERDFTAMTMAIDLAKLPEAKKRIKNFRREMAGLLATDNQTEVYTLNIQLFRLTGETK